MSSLQQLEDRLQAWRSFRGIARATRALAAAQSLQWNEAARRAEAHRQRCLAILDAYPGARPSAGAPRIVLGVGSDLGLCGPFNRAIAERLGPARARASRTLVIGARLGQLVGEEASCIPSPTSFARAEALATELELLLADAPAERTHLVVVLATGVDPDGRPRVELLDETSPSPSPGLTAVELVGPERTEPLVAATARHARLVAALARSAASETEARWRTMNRAHDAADRRIGEQERELRKRRQELVTQEMLEARQGGRAPIA
ncbi:MAG: F0F1 ATP synthase subunit gamma [Myxococcales bacterium]|nr:F0F1 ATP synthase subunit gamma [Myxococcales bacterium]MCB9715404.1 F0F1 ATP synthase subunit gamma [Myxococcales bacterium]